MIARISPGALKSCEFWSLGLDGKSKSVETLTWAMEPLTRAWGTDLGGGDTDLGMEAPTWTVEPRNYATEPLGEELNNFGFQPGDKINVTHPAGFGVCFCLKPSKSLDKTGLNTSR